jgi:hypothetical protein
VTRTRILVPVVALVFTTGLGTAAPALAQEEAPTADRPAIVVEDAGPSPAATDEAWTFRYLIPTVLALAGLAIAATAVLYGVRVRGRYRVVR